MVCRAEQGHQFHDVRCHYAVTVLCHREDCNVRRQIPPNNSPLRFQVLRALPFIGSDGLKRFSARRNCTLVLWNVVFCRGAHHVSNICSSIQSFVSTVPLLPPLFTGMEAASPHLSLSDLLSLFGAAYVGNLVTAMCVCFGHSPPTVVYEGSSNAVFLFAFTNKDVLGLLLYSRHAILKSSVGTHGQLE